MSLFWVCVALVVVAVLLLLMRPFFWQRSDASVSHRELNAAIFRDQFNRLDSDRAENLIGEAEYTQARVELNRRVLEEAGVEDASLSPRPPRRTLLLIGFVLPLAAVALYLLLGNPAALRPQDAAPAVLQQDVERMVDGLAKRLESEPDNGKGWVMLARSYKIMGRVQEAEQAFARAGSFIDKDAQLLAMYADVVVTNAGGSFTGKPMQLIDKALKLDPDNVMALWLAGSAASQRHNDQQAIRYWERISRQLVPDSDDARVLQESINAARARLGKPGVAHSAKKP